MAKVWEAADAALDVLLTDAADGGSRFLRSGAAVKVSAALARRPSRAARRAGHLGAKLARVAGGRSDLRPGYRIAEEHPAAPETWLDQAATLPGSWWADYDEWLAARSGELVPAPKITKRGAKAPGSYVHAR